MRAPSSLTIRRAAAVAGIALVCGGVAGRLAASTAPASEPPVPATPVASAGTAPTPAAVYRADAPGIVVVTDAATTQGPSIPFLPQSRQKVQQLGSGFVLDRNGDIVTNDHVIAGGSAIRIGFGGDKTYAAKVVGDDPATDLAVLRVSAPASLLHPLAFGSSARVAPGDPVYAIGNPFGLERTITAGIVSAVGRDIQAPDGRTIPQAIQTDTAINHGNSGGPLLDANGRVIGVTSQIQGGTVDGNVGVGFAIPGDTARSIAQQLVSHGSATHAWLGVQVRDGAHGVVVGKVSPRSPAAQARIAPGDVITALDGRGVQTADELAGTVAAHRPGDRITLAVRHGGTTRTVTVSLGDLPAST
jgi:putative serine protease PepD